MAMVGELVRVTCLWLVLTTLVGAEQTKGSFTNTQNRQHRSQRSPTAQALLVESHTSSAQNANSVGTSAPLGSNAGSATEGLPTDSVDLASFSERVEQQSDSWNLEDSLMGLSANFFYHGVLVPIGNLSHFMFTEQPTLLNTMLPNRVQGDFDRNGIVDANDYFAWQRRYEKNSPTATINIGEIKQSASLPNF